MNNTKKREILAIFAAFFANFIFGFSFLFSDAALRFATPSVLLAYRFALAFLVLNVLRLFGIIKLNFKGKRLRGVILMGIMQPVLYFYCENYGLLNSSVTFSAIMLALVPIGAMLYSAVFMKEPTTLLQFLFGVLSVAGVILMSGKGGGKTSVFGVLLLCGAIVTAVGFNAASRKYASEFSPVERTYIMFAVASAVFVLAALLENAATPEALIKPLGSAEFIVSVFYLGVISSVAAFIMINYANTYLPISRTTVFSNVITVVSIFAGIVILKETALSVQNALFSLMIIVGVWGVQKFAK